MKRLKAQSQIAQVTTTEIRQGSFWHCPDVLCVAAFAFLLLLPFNSRSEEAIRVFAASSLTDVLRTIAKQQNTSVNFSFAASSAIARQIQAGAPADIFVSADTQWMDVLQAEDLIQANSRRDLISNRLVMIAPSSSTIVPISLTPQFDLRAYLGEHGRLAIGNPNYVPAGAYAREALLKLGLWHAVEDRLVRGENVRAALNFVARGEAPLGIVFRSDAALDGRVVNVHSIDDSLHAPIRYPAALTTNARPAARAFLENLSGAESRAVFLKFGFVAIDSADN